VQLYYELLLRLCKDSAKKKNHFFKDLLQNCFVFTVFFGFSLNCTEQDLSARVSFWGPNSDWAKFIKKPWLNFYNLPACLPACNAMVHILHRATITPILHEKPPLLKHLTVCIATSESSANYTAVPLLHIFGRWLITIPFEKKRKIINPI